MSSRPLPASLKKDLAADPRATWVVLILFATSLALFGGASRYDAIQIVPLRTFAALFLIPALYFMTSQKLRQDATLVAALLLLVALMVLQLIPLPPGLWRSLPMRDVIGQMDSIIGLDDNWRPLSLAPMRTWNALGSLLVPVSALFLAIGLGAKSRTLLQVIAGLGVLNALLGLLQVLSGKASPLYFYELTNRGSAVGIFANENHSAIFAACALLTIARLEVESRIERRGAMSSIVHTSAFFFIFIVALVSGSRAGFAASLGAMLISLFMVWRARARGSKKAGALTRMLGNRSASLALVVPFVGIALIVGAFVALGRAPAFQDILAKDSFADLRWSILPIEFDMVRTFWLFGSGFGSFEQVYQIFEPAELLMPMYINQAHNDWLQLLIEGGIIAVALLVGLLVWVVRRIVRLSHRPANTSNVIYWICVFGVIGAASLIDYPLRTPIFQCLSVWLLYVLASDIRDEEAT